MKINQSLLAKVGWIITGYQLYFIIYNFFARYEIREEVLSAAKPEEIEMYNQVFDLVVKSYVIDWSIILCTGAFICKLLHKWLRIRYGICACISIIICRLIYFCSLQIGTWYENVSVMTTVYPSAIITLVCCIISITPLVGVALYKKMTG